MRTCRVTQAQRRSHYQVILRAIRKLIEPGEMQSAASAYTGTIRLNADKTVTRELSYLVDMAKAEALDAMGENRAATELVERYL